MSKETFIKNWNTFFNDGTNNENLTISIGWGGELFQHDQNYFSKKELKEFINSIQFHKPICPIFQNVNAKAVVDENEIKKNLIDQMVSPVKWSESIINMISIGAKNFTEIGPGKVLCGLIKMINRDVLVEST